MAGNRLAAGNMLLGWGESGVEKLVRDFVVAQLKVIGRHLVDRKEFVFWSAGRC